MVRSVMAPYQNAGFFALRTPLLPYRCFFALSEGVEPKSRCLEAELADMLRRERDRVMAALREAIEPAPVREALRIASPHLEQALDQWERGELKADAARKLVNVLYRYVGRMSTRSTPFGLFAGSSIGRLTRETRLDLAAREAGERHTGLDNSYLFLLLQDLGADPAYRARATYYPNNGLYAVGGKLRYAEASIDAATATMSYQLCSLERDEYLQRTLDAARDGATVSTLVEALAGEDVSPEEAEQFVESLLDNQILVSDLSLAVTGLEPLLDACEQLQAHPELAVEGPLAAAVERLQQLDRHGVGAPPRAYEDVVTELRRLPVGELELSRLFHVDLYKPLVSDKLGRDVISELRSTVAQLYRIAPARQPTELDELAAAFAARYGEEQVPLGVALDPELGIAAGRSTVASEATPLLETLEFEEAAEESSLGSASLTPRDLHLLQQLRATWMQGEREWALDEDDLRALEVPGKPPLPSSFAGWFQLARRGGAEHEMLFSTAVGPPAGRLLGRFAHGSPRLTELVRGLGEREARLEPEAVLAEIVHLPEGRTGNVVCRPVLREYEIPYLGRSGAPRDRQIPIDDLWLSLEAGCFVLRSRRLGCRVIPRLSSAHNITHNTVPLYRFLARLQFQEGINWLSWSWGRFFAAPHLPRVRIGSTLVSRERWTLDGRDLGPLREGSAVARYRHLLRLRRRYRMPRFVALADGDNELAVDLENPVSIDSLADLIKSRPMARLVELWPGPEEAGVPGEDGAYVNEFIVPFVRNAPNARPPAPDLDATRVAGRAPGVPRIFAPGSEWLHLKLVTSKSSADEVITHVLQPELEWLTEEGGCDRWLFAPLHGDPWAVGLYLHGEAARLESLVLPRLGRSLRALMADGPLLSWSVQTHVEPLERFGGQLAAREAEALMFHDSRAALALMADSLPEGGEDLRWRLVLLSVDRLLGDLGLSLDERVEVVSALRHRRQQALPAGAALEAQLSRKYRGYRGEVEALLQPGEPGGPLAEVHEVLAARSRRLEPVVARLHQLRDRGELTRPWSEVVRSLVESTSARLLRGAAAAHELVIFDFLRRSYRSRRGRAKARRRGVAASEGKGLGR